MKTWIILLCSWMSLSAQAAVQGRAVDYTLGNMTFKGYLVAEEGTRKRPGVLVVHEWWGHNEYARKKATALAEAGYVALAVDMYGDGKQAQHPKEAGEFASAVQKDLPLAKARFEAALAFLKQQPEVDPKNLSAIGYCFGGGIVLEMARQGLDLKGVASFHGSLATAQPAQPGTIKAKILVLHGAADQLIPPEKVTAFEQEMRQAKAEWELISYPNVQHSFTNPDADHYAKQFALPLAYDEHADKDSWAKLLNFLTTVSAQTN